MTQIIIRGKKPEQEQEALEALQAIEGIQVEIVETEENETTKPNFLSLAGKWKDRNINSETWRADSWRKNENNQ